MPGVMGCSRSGPAFLDTQAGACLALVEVLAVVGQPGDVAAARLEPAGCYDAKGVASSP